MYRGIFACDQAVVFIPKIILFVMEIFFLYKDPITNYDKENFQNQNKFRIAWKGK